MKPAHRHREETRGFFASWLGCLMGAPRITWVGMTREVERKSLAAFSSLHPLNLLQPMSQKKREMTFPNVM